MILAVMLLPASASAGTMGSYGKYDANPGEVNSVVASADGSRFSITDSAGALAGPDSLLPGQGDCLQVNPTTISCAYGSLDADLGDQNDTFSYAGGAFPASNAVNALTVTGGTGSDSISGSPFKDDLRGSDTRTGVPDPVGNDTMLGNEGDDTIADSDGTSNSYSGGAGEDRITAGTGQNSLSGGPGIDIVLGGSGPETLSGGDDADDMNGGPGADNVLGEGGNDTVEGGADQDTSDGGPGNDVLSKQFHKGGCSLAPKLDGGPDTLIGGPGIDSVAVSCNTPILKLRDGEPDKGSCAPRVDSAVKEYDKKLDLISGGACATLVCKGKKKKKKGKKSSAIAAAKKGKKKKKKCKPYKPPEDLGGFSLRAGLLSSG